MEAVVKQARTARHPGWWRVMPIWTPVNADEACGTRRSVCSLRCSKQVYPRVAPGQDQEFESDGGF